MESESTGKYFLIIGLVSLLLAMCFGCMAAFQYVYPETLAKILPFYITRPMHTSLVLGWIFSGSIGLIYLFLPDVMQRKLAFPKLVKFHLYWFVLCGILIMGSIIQGVFGGREYWSFTPTLVPMILISWFIFMIVFFATSAKTKEKWPIHMWMWTTGIIGFLLTYIETNLWHFPFFRESLGRELAVQWKSYGSMVGAWNMLIYGSQFYVMGKIFGESKNKKSHFFFYFLSLTNMMFNWAHHGYTIPMDDWIKHLAYAISMTEWIFLVKIYLSWKKQMPNPLKKDLTITHSFLNYAEFWILFNLVFALLISIPSINHLTHGTHMTVVHSMGTTIGINSMLLFACIFYALGKHQKVSQSLLSKIGLPLTNGAILVFLGALFWAGMQGSKIKFADQPYNMASVDYYSGPLMIVFLSGLAILIGFSMLMYLVIFQKNKTE